MLVTTVTTFVMAGAMLLLFPMSWRGRRESGAPAAGSVARAPRAVPRVRVVRGSVILDDNEVARTDVIEETQRVQRIDGLFDAIRRRRFEDESVGPRAETVEVEVAPDVVSVVVKSTLQTLAFAGYTDVRFVLADGGTVRSP